MIENFSNYIKHFFKRHISGISGTSFAYSKKGRIGAGLSQANLKSLNEDKKE